MMTTSRILLRGCSLVTLGFSIVLGANCVSALRASGWGDEAGGAIVALTWSGAAAVCAWAAWRGSRRRSGSFAERCIACNKAFAAGDEYLPDINGGAIHFACCGPEPESFVDLKTGEPLTERPLPSIWGED